MLLPQALCTIAAVGLLYATVRRAVRPGRRPDRRRGAGRLARHGRDRRASTTPTRCSCCCSSRPRSCTVRALESGRTRTSRWRGAARRPGVHDEDAAGLDDRPGAGRGLPASPGRRACGRASRQLPLAGVVDGRRQRRLAGRRVAVAGRSQPYIGGSTDGSVWDLILGYNGFGRDLRRGRRRGRGRRRFGGAAGLWRMFNAQVGGQIAWLLPLAAVGLGAGLWLTRRGARTGLAAPAGCSSASGRSCTSPSSPRQQGIFHPYYVSALAPAVAALAGVGVVALWRWARESWARRRGRWPPPSSATAWVAVDAARAARRTSRPWLRVAIPVAAALAVARLVALRRRARPAPRSPWPASRPRSRWPAARPPTASPPPAASLNGNNVLAGPASAGAGFGGGPGGPGGSSSGGGPAAAMPAAGRSDRAAAVRRRPVRRRPLRWRRRAGGASVDASLLAYLEAHQGSAKYLVAATGSQTTAPIIIQTGKAGRHDRRLQRRRPRADRRPARGDGRRRRAQVRAALEQRRLRRRRPGGNGSSSALTQWVKQHGKAVSGVSTSGGTLYQVSA